jgi:hypothetical protein
LRRKCFKRSSSALLWIQFERGIASVGRQRQHVCKERHILGRRETLRQQGIEFAELCLSGVAMREPSGALHLAGDGIKRAVRVLW